MNSILILYGRGTMGNLSTRRVEEDRGKPDPSSSYTLGVAGEDDVPEIPLVHAQPVLAICPADSTHTITGTNDNSLLVYQWTCHIVKQNFKLRSKPATRIVYNRSRQMVYAASRDGGVYGWRWPSVDPVEDNLLVLKDHTLSVTGVATNEDMLVSGSRDNSVKVWDINSQSPISSVHIPRNLVTDMKWIQGEGCVLQSSEDKTIRIWDVRTCSVAQRMPCKQHIQLCCAVSDCGNYVASGSSGQQGSGSELTLWDRRSFRADSSNGFVREYKGHSSSVNSCLFVSPGGDTAMIASCSNDSTIRVWDRDKGACVLSEYISGAGPISEVVSPSPSLLACSTFHKGVKVWGLQKSQNNEYALNLRAKY